MSYDLIKILHIISATLLLMSIVISFRLWKKTGNVVSTIRHLQTQTGLIIVPLAILQMASGFTMISLKHYDLSELWVKGSITGFLVAIISWLGFTYCALTSSLRRRLQLFLLYTCVTALLVMLFFMVNKV